MCRINPAKAALSVGTVIGLLHILWSILVATGAAKAVMGFVLKMHFVRLDFTIAPFDIVTAVMLIALAFAIGAVFGLVFSLVWNCLAKGEQP